MKLGILKFMYTLAGYEHQESKLALPQDYESALEQLLTKTRQARLAEEKAEKESEARLLAESKVVDLFPKAENYTNYWLDITYTFPASAQKIDKQHPTTINLSRTS